MNEQSMATWEKYGTGLENFELSDDDIDAICGGSWQDMFTEALHDTKRLGTA